MTAFARPAVMGVLNVTPDSFSDGGAFLEPGRGGCACASAWRPRARTSSTWAASRRARAPSRCRPDEELRRVMPVIERLAAARHGPAVDRHLEGRGGARRAPTPAPCFVNDVTALRGDAGDGGGRWPSRAPSVCLMHMQGEPRTMQDDPRYEDVVSEVKAFLEERLGFAVGAGHRRGARLARPRHRLRQDARAQPRAAAPPGRDRRPRAAGRDRGLRASGSSAR